jgi:rubrerythrin
MTIKFNADEVFHIAEQIEDNGAAFYRKAAELNADAGDVQFLNDLAAMEDEHKAIFKEMHQQVSEAEKESTAYDPYGEAMQYLATLADTHGGEGSPDAAAALTGDESMEDILKKGMELERKSILFYMGMKELVAEEHGRDKLDQIIGEEKKHLMTLSKELQDRKA